MSGQGKGREWRRVLGEEAAKAEAQSLAEHRMLG